MSNVSINTVFNVAIDFEIASFPKRLLAYTIDFTLMASYMFAMQLLMYNVAGLNESNNVGLDILVVSFPMLIYSLVTEFLLNGQTIGKKVVEIRVVSLQGGAPNFSQYLIRWITKFFEWPFLFGKVALIDGGIFAYIVATAFAGMGVVIAIAVSRKSQRIGDSMAGTVVVNTNTKLNINDTIFLDTSNMNYKVTYPEVMRLSDNDINTINSILGRSTNSDNHDLVIRVSYKLQDLLKIKPGQQHHDFLRTLLADYNYLATKE